MNEEINATSDARISALSQMTPNLRQVAAKFDSMLKSAARGEVLIKFDIGVRLKWVYAQVAEYGDDAVERLSRYLGIPASGLLSFLEVATKFSRAEVVGAIAKPMSDGGYLSFQHFVHISAILKAADRQRFMELTRKSAWSAHQLAEEIDLARVECTRRVYSQPAGPKPFVERALTGEVLRIVFGQLELEDPTQFDLESMLSDDEPDPPLVTLIREDVTQAVNELGDNTDVLKALRAAWVRLSRTAELFSRSVAPLWLAQFSAQTGVPVHPLKKTLSERDVAIAYPQYVSALKGLAKSIRDWPDHLQNLPVTHLIADETESLAECMRFLLQRRSQLRRKIHPNVCQYTGDERNSEMGADRADETLTFYERIMACEAECPENWTVRDRPDVVERDIVMLLTDLHHLADRTEMSWSSVMKSAQAAYEESLADGD